jgi:hypothetical protein
MPNHIDKETKDIIGELPKDVFCPISHKDFLIYLQNAWPFIQVINPDEVFEGEVPRKITKSTSGWQIIRYGNIAICASPGKFLFGESDDSAFMKSIIGGEKPDEDSGPVIYTGKGTVIKQTHDTVVEIVKMVLDSNWKGVDLVGGTKLMEEMLWRECEEKGLTLDGYEPDEEAKVKAERRQRQKERLAQLPEFEMVKPK